MKYTENLPKKKILNALEGIIKEDGGGDVYRKTVLNEDDVKYKRMENK